EERHGVLDRKRGKREFVLPFESERGAARDEELQPRRGAQQPREELAGGDDLLEVVGNEERSPRREMALEHLLGCATGLVRAERLHHRRRNQLGLEDRRQRDERGAVGKVRLDAARSLDGESRLPHAAEAGQGDEPNAVAANEVDDRVDLAGATDERREELGERRARGTTKRLPWAADRLVLPQDRTLQVAQRGARCDAELLVELRTRVLVGGERVRLASGSIEGEHQLLAETLAERVTLDE